jgi:hypothetical protein
LAWIPLFVLLGTESATPQVHINLDADTLVQDNYLSALYVKTLPKGRENGDRGRMNIKMPCDYFREGSYCCYEIFFYELVLGLKYTRKSPWAFHFP